MASGEESSGSRNDSFPIKTVVVLVQENRSFDHMLGWFKSLNPEINGVTGSESNPVSTSDSNSSVIFFGDNAPYVDPDPGHSIQAIYEQVFGKPWTESDSSNPSEPTMSGFVQNAEKTQKGMGESVMRGFRPDDLPVYKELVSNFGICDRWFASVPASTQPNRMYVHSATSHGASSNNTEELIKGFPQKTIFESLEESGFSFGIYYQIPPATLFYRNLRKLKYLDNFHQFDLSFKKHCEEGKLPNYVVIEQRYWNLLSIPANDDHPSHDVSEGQKFVKQVYEALRSSPQWNEMLLVITYDEHGGFYDHVPTPTNVPSPDDIVGYAPFYFKFDRLGVRVPTFFVSPWIEPGTVLHGPSGPQSNSEFEHSSIPATVKKIFNLKNFLTKRDAWAGTFEGVITRDTPRTDCPVTLPEVRKKLLLVEPNESVKLSEFQQELVQMAAVLKGDHMRDIYPDKLVEQMTVAEGANYVEEALKTFWEECKKAKEKGANDSDIVVLGPEPTPRPRPRSFAQRIFSCLICDN